MEELTKVIGTPRCRLYGRVSMYGEVAWEMGGVFFPPTMDPQRAKGNFR